MKREIEHLFQEVYMINYEIAAEPVGFIVYAMHEGARLSLVEFARTTSMDILQVTQLMAKEGGFKAEPKDALAFFLFEDRAKAFITTLESM